MTRLGNKSTRLLVSLLIMLCSFTGAVKASSSSGEIEIIAGQAEFDPETQLFTGRGGVVMKSGETVIKAEEVVVDGEGWIEAAGGVELTLPSLLVHGEKLRYNIHAETGEIVEFQGRKDQTYFRGSRGEIAGANLYIKDAAFTRCSLPVPDLEFAAGELRIEEEIVSTGWGRLRIKGISLLPLPPLTVSLEKSDQWPSVEAGIDREWGVYCSAHTSSSPLQRVALTAGATVGTTGRVRLAAGLNWRPVDRWQLGAGYNWDNRAGENMIYSLKFTGAKNQFSADLTNSRQEGGAPYGRSDLRVVFPLAPQLQGEVSQSRTYPGKITGLSSLKNPESESYSLKMSKKGPRLSTSVSLIHSRGNLRGRALPGWGLETAVRGKIPLTAGWELAAAASYLWGEEEGLWTTRRVEIIKDLHCFKASLGYDLLEGNWGFSLNLAW